MRTFAASAVRSAAGRESGSAIEPWLLIVVFVSLFAGIFLRLHNVADKPCSYDECYSRMRIAGFDRRELETAWNSCRQPIPVDDMKAFMRCRFKPAADLPWRAIVQEDFQVSPVYYWIGRGWVRLFGESAAALRYLSIAFSFLSLPLMFLLCLELFSCKRTAVATLGILAASPVFVIYAQQIRHYDIWIVIVLLASLMLLRAVKRSTFWNWTAYTVSLALSLLINPLSLSFALGHAAFVSLAERWRFSSRVKAFCTSAFVASLVFLPRVFLSSFDCITGYGLGWLAVPPRGGLRQYLLTIFCNSSRLFWASEPFGGRAGVIVISAVIVCLLIWALVHLVKNGSREQMLFVATLVFSSLLAMICRDALVTGRGASVTRYLFPTLVGLVLAMGFMFSGKTGAETQSRPAWMTAIWRVGFVTLILGALQSSYQLVSAQTSWASWPKVTDTVPESVRLINQSYDPVVLIPWYGCSAIPLVLADRLRSDARLIPACSRPDQWLPMLHSQLRSGRDVFLWDPLDALVGRLQADPALSVNEVESASALRRIALSPYRAALPEAGRTRAN